MRAVEKCLACGNLYSSSAGDSPARNELRMCPKCGASGGDPTPQAASQGSDSSYPEGTDSPAPLLLPPYYQQALARAGQTEQLAREQLAVPAVLLMVWGGVWILMALAAWGISIAAAIDGKDPLLPILIFAGIGVWLAISGALVFVGGLCLRRLRRYRLALGVTLYGVAAGIVLCLPLSLLGIWPLVILLRPKVRQAFHGKSA
jgi:hypothetical protein